MAKKKKRRKQQYTGGQLLLAAAGGALAGAAVTALTTPRPGTETRARLAATLQRGRTQLAKLAPALQRALQGEQGPAAVAGEPPERTALPRGEALDVELRPQTCRVAACEAHRPD